MNELRRILLVEDDADIQVITQMALEVAGPGRYEVEVCSSGSEALEKAPRFKPDLILLDVMMAGMDGPTTLGALRDVPETRHTPVVFMTAKVQLSEITRYKQLGAIGVITKPFDPMTISMTVEELWRQHLGSPEDVEGP